jgi:hypothetical protein
MNEGRLSGSRFLPSNVGYVQRMRNRIFANGAILQRCGEQRKTAGRPAELYELHSPPLEPNIEQED